MKKYADAIFFHMAICVVGATNMLYRRAKSEICLAIPSTRSVCGMEKKYEIICKS